MLKLTYIVTAISLSLSMSQSAHAMDLGKQIVSQGNGKGATACLACHGMDGAGQAAAGFPMLAGLNKAYLQKQIKDMVKGSRNAPVMSPIAKALTDEEIKAVATYYSNLPPPAAKAAGNDAALMEQGKQLAESGNWSKNIPACYACHGDAAAGVGTHFPTLAGQNANYIGQQIQAWKSGQRLNDPNQLMKGIAERLSVQEIKAVSAYLSSLANGQ